MKIALLHYRAGLMDGVSLEMEKWKHVLEKMGHQVIMVAGNEVKSIVRIKEMGFEDELYRFINKNAFENLEVTPENLLRTIEDKALQIEEKFDRFLEDYDVIFPNNVWSLGAYLPTAIALERYAQRTEKLFVAHHHDFWWEREYYLHPTTSKIKEMLEEYCPPDLKNVKHVVINSKAKEALKERKKLNATVIPNVMDFDAPPFVSEKLNEDIRKEFDLKLGDIVFLQATRITPRKAIELAIDLIKEVKKKVKKGAILYNGQRFSGRIVLAFSGMCEDEEYKERLYSHAKEEKVEILDMYKSVEARTRSFWDLYSVADMVTYPSILEGWGNQLLEAVVAKKPVVIFEYEIFKSDIKKSGLEDVSLGDTFEVKNSLVKVSKEKIERAANECVEILFDSLRYSRMVENNFKIGKKYFSYTTLEKLIRQIMET